jgi:hypothetical protein
MGILSLENISLEPTAQNSEEKALKKISELGGYII